MPRVCVLWSNIYWLCFLSMFFHCLFCYTEHIKGIILRMSRILQLKEALPSTYHKPQIPYRRYTMQKSDSIFIFFWKVQVNVFSIISFVTNLIRNYLFRLMYRFCLIYSLNIYTIYPTIASYGIYNGVHNKHSNHRGKTLTETFRKRIWLQKSGKLQWGDHNQKYYPRQISFLYVF